MGRWPAFSVLVALAVAPPTDGRSDEDRASLEAERARFRAELERTRDPAAACSLASIERRLGDLDAAAGHLDDAVRRLVTTALDAAGTTTLAACRYERGRVHEARSDFQRALELYAEALGGSTERRRPIVESAIVRAASSQAASRCPLVASPAEIRAILRLGDDAALRRCLAQAESDGETMCRPVPRDETFPLDQLVDPTTVDAATTVGVRAGLDGDELLYIARRTGNRARLVGCDFTLPMSSHVSHAAWLGAPPNQILNVSSART